MSKSTCKVRKGKARVNKQNNGNKKIKSPLSMSLLLIILFATFFFATSGNATRFANDDDNVLLQNSAYKQLLHRVKAAEAEAHQYKSAYENLQKACSVPVKVTAYNATVEQCGKSDGITSSGAKVQAGRTLAVSKDLRHLMGRWVNVVVKGETIGTYRVEDRMAGERRVDVYMDHLIDAKQFGVRRATIVPI